MIRQIIIFASISFFPSTHAENQDASRLMATLYAKTETTLKEWKLERQAILGSTLVMRWADDKGWVHGGIYLNDTTEAAVERFKERESLFDSVNIEDPKYTKSIRDIPTKQSIYWLGPFATPKTYILFRYNKIVVELDGYNPSVLEKFNSFVFEIISKDSKFKSEQPNNVPAQPNA